MPANLIFSYGMTKTGSTLAFELTRAALTLAGHRQERLSLDAVMDRKKINFVQHVDAKRADALRREVDRLGTPIVVKTHTRPDPAVIAMLQSGEAIATAAYRDPRDMALSMLDHGVRARAKGKASFSEFVSVEDTIDQIQHQTNSLAAWLTLPNVLPVYYEDLAFDMPRTTRGLIDHLGVQASVEDAMAIALTERFIQFNKGVSARHKDEMSRANSDRFLAIFAPLYDQLIDNKDNLNRDGTPVLPQGTILYRAGEDHMTAEEGPKNERIGDQERHAAQERV